MAVCESVGVGWGHDDPGTLPELASAFACLRYSALAISECCFARQATLGTRPWPTDHWWAGPASFAAFARQYGGVGSAGSAHQINEEAHRLGAQTGCSTVIAKYLYEAFNGRGCAATPGLANPRRSGGDARTLAR